MSLNRTTFAKAAEVLGLRSNMMTNFGSFLGEGSPTILSKPMAHLVLWPLVIIIPAAAMLYPWLFSWNRSKLGGGGGGGSKSESKSKKSLFERFKAAMPAQWQMTYKCMEMFVPYFVPETQEAASRLAFNLTMMGASLAAQRALNLITPLLLRHVVDTLSMPMVVAQNVTVAAAASMTTADHHVNATVDGLSSAITGSSSSASDVLVHFPWRAIVGYVLSRHLINRVLSNYEWGLERLIWLDAADRIAAAAYRHLLTLGADFHEGSHDRSASGAKKDGKEEGGEKEEGKKTKTDDEKDTGKDAKKDEKKKDEKGKTSSALAYSAVCNASGGIARFIAHALFEIGPALLDLVLGVVSFWRVSGGRVALAMSFMLFMYVAALFYFEDTQRTSWKKTRDAHNVRNNLVSDTARNWSTVALFAREGYEQDRFADASRALLDAEREQAGARFFQDSHQAATRLVLVGGLLSLGLFAGWQIRVGERSVGDFVMLIQYWSELIDHVRSLLYYFGMMDSFITNVDQLTDILEREPSVRDREGAPEFVLGDGSIEFDNVGFSYPGAKGPAVDGISFSIRGGQTVAVVGETGGGKSTLLKLLTRMRDCSSGAVRVDGQDVRDVTRASLLEHVAIVPQAIGVFGATLRDNVSYGRLDATPEDVEAACEAARLHKKIKSSFGDGYDEKVGQGGTTQLSGGEAQRLAIARALVRGSGAKIVLFDEAMSSLDAETEWEIQRNVRTWCKDRTTVIISHRLATVAHADLILAVRDGRVVEAGTQRELLRKEGYYHSLWTKQKLEEEQ